MTMIGPAAPRQLCPACKGSGIDHIQTVPVYRPGWPLPESGRWIDAENPIDCDICAGTGRVTKKTLRQWQAEQRQAAAGPGQGGE